MALWGFPCLGEMVSTGPLLSLGVRPKGFVCPSTRRSLLPASPVGGQQILTGESQVGGSQAIGELMKTGKGFLGIAFPDALGYLCLTLH